MDQLTRKEFFRRLAQAGLAAGLLGRLGLPASAAPRSRVVLAHHPGVLRDGVPVPEVVTAMVNRAVSSLVGKPTLAAWKTLFRPEDVVGIKVNCSAGERPSTRPEVVQAIAQGAISAGVKPENVYIYDRGDRELLRAGYQLNREGPGVRCLGIGRDYDPEPTVQGRFHGCLCRLLSERITALVNVPLLKDHALAGITFAMKNHYGSIANPGDHHAQNCIAAADLNAVPAIVRKTRLILGECIWGLADGGPDLMKPGALWVQGMIMATRDPVAADYTAWQLVAEARQRMGLKPLVQVGREPRCIAAAAALGLGTNDPERIELVRLSVA